MEVFQRIENFSSSIEKRTKKHLDLAFFTAEILKGSSIYYVRIRKTNISHHMIRTRNGKGGKKRSFFGKFYVHTKWMILYETLGTSG